MCKAQNGHNSRKCLLHFGHVAAQVDSTSHDPMQIVARKSASVVFSSMSISKVGNGRRGRGGIPSVAPLVPQLLERIQSCATRGFLVGAKPKLVDDTFFFLSQF